MCGVFTIAAERSGGRAENQTPFAALELQQLQTDLRCEAPHQITNKFQEPKNQIPNQSPATVWSFSNW
jgi:hypothetical protein